ncbi:MAG: hypothetical protein Q9227_009244 [Pyrenula ochraceoflavens]
MNWTGGRLQRHSKANANTSLKSQRQHFARARLQQQSGRRPRSPPRLSFYDPQDGWRPTSDFDRHEREAALNGVQKSPKRENPGDAGSTCLPNDSWHHFSQPVQKLGFRKRRHSMSLGRDTNSHLQKHESHHSTAHRSSNVDQLRSQAPPSRKFASVESTTLEAIKHSLLRRSDWMEISTVQPLAIEFPSVEEIQGIGKRRRITGRHESRRNGIARYCPLPSLDQGMQKPQNPVRYPKMCVQQPSIRMGSKIHQSQTTGNGNSRLSDPASSETMLLDREHGHALDLHLKDPINAIWHGNEITDERTVSDIEKEPFTALPLDKVLDYQNFDQVKARTVSLSPKKIDLARSGASTPWTTRRAANRDVTTTSEMSVPKAQSNPSVYPSSPPLLPPLTDVPIDTDFTGSKSVRQHGSVSSNLPTCGKLPKHTGLDRLVRTSSPTPQNEHAAYLAKSGGHSNTASHLSPSIPRIFTLDRQIKDASQRRATPCEDQQNRERRSVDILDPSSDFNGKLFPRHPNPLNPKSPATTYPEIHGSKGLRERFYHPLWRKNYESDVSDPDLRKPQSPKNLGSFQDQAVIHPVSEARTPMRERLGTRDGPTPRSIRPMEDENEAWMKFVFGSEFEKVQNRFQTKDKRISQPQRKVSFDQKGMADEDNLLDEMRWDSSEHAIAASPKTINTSANTALFFPGPSQSRTIQKSPCTTDFMSRLSPMTGCLDERLGKISNYTNPVRSERSFISAVSQRLNESPARPPSCHLSQILEGQPEETQHGNCLPATQPHNLNLWQSSPRSRHPSFGSNMHEIQQQERFSTLRKIS